MIFNRSILIYSTVSLSLLCYFIATSHGLLKTSDSYLFLETSQHLHSKGFESLYDLEFFRAKPPLFAFIILCFYENETFLTFFNCGLWLSFLFTSFQIVQSQIRDKKLQILSFIYLGLSPILLANFVFLWIEPLYLLLLNLAFLSIIRQKKWFVIAILLCTMISLKYSAIFLTAGFWLYFIQKKEIKKSFFIAIPPVFTFLIYQVSLYIYVQNTERLDYLEQLDLSQNIILYSKGFFGLLAPRINSIPELLYLTSIGLIILLLYKSKKLLFQFSTAIYLIIMIFKGDLLEWDIDRYLSIILLPLLILIVTFFESKKTKYFSWVMIIVCCISLLRIIKNTYMWYHYA